MTDKNAFGLSRRRLLGGIATVGAAGALGGAGTMAFFSDEEQFANNRLMAGSLDMKAAYSAHYSDWSPDEGEGVEVRMWDGAPDTTGTPDDLEGGETGLPSNEAWLIAVDDPEQFLENTQTMADGVANCGPDGTDADDLDQPIIDLDDVKPGDFGEVTFDFALCDNPGFVWLRGNLVSASENGTTEPERKDDDEDYPEGDEVELLDVVQVAIWDDDGNNYQNGEETLMFTGSLRDVIVGELGEATPPGVGLDGDIPAEEGGGMGRNCFSAETTHSLGFAWWVPVDHGNEIQTDTATFSLGFYTEQCRHNTANGGGGQQVQCRTDEGWAKLQPELEGETSWHARSIIADNDAGTGAAGNAELDIRDSGDNDLAEAGGSYPGDGTAVPWTLTYNGGTAEFTVNGNTVSTTGPEPTSGSIGITAKASDTDGSISITGITLNDTGFDCEVTASVDEKAYAILEGAEFREGDTLSGMVAYTADGASGEDLGFRIDV